MAYNFSTMQLHWLPVKFRIIFKDCNADAPNPAQPLSVVSHRPGRVQHGGLTTTSAQVVTNHAELTSCNGRGPTSANAPSLSANLIHWTVFLQRSATLTVIQRSDELSGHSCFIVLLLINFYFIFYTYAHSLLTIVIHSRPCLYDWAL